MTIMKESLHILMITHHRRPKAFARSHAMASQLVRRGHNVTLMVTAETRKLHILETEWDGVRTIETPDILWGRLRSGWDLWGLLNRIYFLSRKKEPYRIVHCFETRPAAIYPALYLFKRFHVPFVTDWNDWYGRGGLINVNRPCWYRVLLGWMETHYEEDFRTRGLGVTVISSALGERAQALGVPPDRICRISGGAFPDEIPSRSKEDCKKHVGISLKTPVLGFSSLDSHLDIDIVFQTLAILARKYPSIKLIITGQTKKSIVEIAQKHKIQGNVIFTGYLPREELFWYLGCADIFLLPFPDTVYNIGRWPNKICDYMCLERPTVSNPYGDIKTLFNEHPIGLLAEYDPIDFATKTSFLLDHPEVSRQMGQTARQVAVSDYDWQHLVDKLEGFYFTVLCSKQSLVES